MSFRPLLIAAAVPHGVAGPRLLSVSSNVGCFKLYVSGSSKRFRGA